MKRKISTLVILALLMGLHAGCVVEPEALEIQKPYEYDEQYYANLSAYKQSDHCIFFGWYAALREISYRETYTALQMALLEV